LNHTTPSSTLTGSPPEVGKRHTGDATENAR
jgi:hypothetical protein